MNSTDYLPLAILTECDYTHKCPEFAKYNPVKLVHYALGLATEALELQEAIRLNRPMSDQLAELGDICWFSGLASDHLGVGLDDKQIIKHIDCKLDELYYLCEAFASRIKAGLCYGSPYKPGDSSADAWRHIPEKIFYRAVAIGRRNGFDVLDLNIKKLKARYGSKFTQPAALERDYVKEGLATEKEIQAVLKG